ncbi:MULTISPECIES: hypothetical protein [Streptomyces]|uniref:hypothetical protein n=1 Tax=Streptomyces TaxID=1883 RepID=UPI00240DAA8A|nr:MULTISPECIES: hypothetical protein [Streptomyces]WFB88486.1 hypothetical protein MMU79_37220 [Streptomyces olivaceus]WGK50929.1 hypothetical protein M6G09_37965 [Streptomyces sp. B146]
MSRRADAPEVAAAIVLLTAEATVLEARSKLLRDELAAVESRIASLHESLHQLHRSAMSAGGTAGSKPTGMSTAGPDQTVRR